MRLQIRDYVPGDESALRAMHAGDGFEYVLPNLADPRLWITRQVLVNTAGRPVMATLGRLTSEAFLLEDPAERAQAAPTLRMRRILSLIERSCEDGRRMGIDTCHAWLAPEIAEKFGPQLERMGWLAAAWQAFVKEI